MKNLKYLLVVLLVCIFVTGCGEGKTVKCTVKNDSSGYEATYKIYVKDDKYVSKVVATEIVKSDDSSYLAQVKEQVESIYKETNNTYGGYSYNVKVSGGKLTAECTMDYAKMNVSKYIEDNPSLTNFADENGNVLLSGVKSIYSQLGATCE